ncbi:MAG: hypothetical protein PHC70_01840 [Patescibacteria group bacterium]|nr:hypothetical protein [Patescibacteria group bacterium]
MDQVASFLASINWATPSWDLFIFLFFIIGSLLYGFSLGRDRIVVILVSVYMALAVVGNAPIVNQVNFAFNINDSYVLRISMFICLFVVLFFFLSRSALLKTIGDGSGSGPWWQVILFSLLQVGLLISVTLSFLPKEILSNFSQYTRDIFLSDMGKSAWLILPIVVMALGPRGSKPKSVE